MHIPEPITQKEDWNILTSFLPEGWREQAHALGAIRRVRKFLDAEALLRTFLIHLAEGCSLRETVVRAQLGSIVSISDVALLKKLKASGEWLRWMAQGLMERWVDRQPHQVYGSQWTIRLIDGTTVQEPGSTGTSWRIHYAIRLPSLCCDELLVSRPQVGESFRRFTVTPGDLLLGDRGYATRPGIAHVVGAQGAVIVRLNLTNVPLQEGQGKPFPLLEQLRTLQGKALGDWPVIVSADRQVIPGRVCALKMSREAAERARRKALAANRRQGRTVRPETLEAAGYVFVFTTLDQRTGPAHILELYRGRWQVELAFKRLKSLLHLSHLRKSDLEAARAWMHGKLLVAFLVEACLQAGNRFFPWGYPIFPEAPEPVAGNVPHAPLHPAGHRP